MPSVVFCPAIILGFGNVELLGTITSRAFKTLVVLLILFVGYRAISVALFKEELVFVCDMQSDTSFPKLSRPDRFTVYFEYMNAYKFPWEQERWHAISTTTPGILEGAWVDWPMARSGFRGSVLEGGVLSAEGDLSFDRLTGNLYFSGSQKLTRTIDGVETEEINFEALCSQID